jgi:hypothetical protein
MRKRALGALLVVLSGFAWTGCLSTIAAHRPLSEQALTGGVYGEGER